MAYVKFDKEFAAAVKQNLNEINEEITLTLSSVSSSFYNKKISLYSSFLKVYDEDEELIADYTNQAIKYNSAADNGGDRAPSIGSSVAAKVNKVVNALDKVISLVETFESQTGLSIESEVGDLSSAFQFLAAYGDASSLSALKGTGVFGNASLDGIYDFDESIFDYDGLSIWSSFGGFLEEQDGEGELENSIREFFLGKLNGFLDKDGNVIIDGKNLGALNSLSMATLLQTDAGKQMKDEFENDYKDKMMQMFFSEGSKEEGMVPFGQSQSTEQELMSSIATALGISSALLGNIKPKNDVGTDDDENSDEGSSRTIVSSVYDVLTGNSELLENNENAGLFLALVDVFDKDLNDSNVLDFMESVGMGVSKDLIKGGASVASGALITGGPAVHDGGEKSTFVDHLIEDVQNLVHKDEHGAIDFDGYQTWKEEQGLDGSSLEHYAEYQKALDLENKNIIQVEAGAGAAAGAAGALDGIVGGVGEGSNVLGKTLEVAQEKIEDFKNYNDHQAAQNTLEANQGGSSGRGNSISQGNSSNQGSSSNQGNSGNSSANSGSSHAENRQISGTQQSQGNNQNHHHEEIKQEVYEPADTSSNQNQVVTPKEDKTSVSSQLPDLPTIKKPEGGNEATASGVETTVEVPEVDTEKIKASTAVVGAAGIGATAILGGGNNNVSLPSISADMSVPTVNAAPTINLDVDLPAAATNVVPSNGGVTNAVTSSGTPTLDNAGVMANNTATNTNSSTGQTTGNAASTTTHSTASSSSQSETLGKGKSSYGTPSDAKSSSTSKAQSSEAKADSEQQEQKTKVEDLDKKLEVDAPEGVLGDSSYAELIVKNEKEVKVATAVTVSSLAFALALKLTNVIGIVSFILVLLAIVLVYTTFRVKKGKERKKLESLIIIEKIKKEEEIKNEETSEENTEVTEVEVTEITEPVDETEVTVVEEVVQEEQPEENVIYQEEIVYVDEDGNVIELPEGAEIVYEEVVIEEETPVQEVEIPEKKEFQSAEEVIYGEMPKESSDK